MSRIQIADLNSSEFGFLYDVNDAEMLAIIGGSWWRRAWKSVLQKKGGGCTQEGGGIVSYPRSRQSIKN
jgi:hypothetical protein